MIAFISNYWAAILMIALGAVAFTLAYRGTRIPPDDTNNKARGGGPPVDRWTP
ncbi:hypothetical protein OE699_03590 [Sedimentimonas flavescens]|uniref:Uncharacterized protein n=1 Tax=Sedimentimonas flavescens TaxID=2851012 RepID=A0ABT2ZWB1_9RHOB|nr:hypothetical protein [Sedimentimonas flavescens]MCV2877926.1 hypothetical protein [Sedimentimonas flavescens]